MTDDDEKELRQAHQRKIELLQSSVRSLQSINGKLRHDNNELRRKNTNFCKRIVELQGELNDRG